MFVPNTISIESAIEVAKTLTRDIGASVFVIQRLGESWAQVGTTSHQLLLDNRILIALDELDRQSNTSSVHTVVQRGVINTEPIALATGGDFATACSIEPKASGYDSGKTAFSSAEVQRVVQRYGDEMVVVIKASKQTRNRVALGFTVANQDESILLSLVSSRIEAICYRDELSSAKTQMESFIDQVTQDFEELTWIRNVNEHFDFFGPKSSLETIAVKCLPDLANVIRAESVVFLPAAGDLANGDLRPDMSRVARTGSIGLEEASYERFLSDFIPGLIGEPRIINRKPDESCIPNYPGLKNCVATTISKDTRVYGWLLALNKVVLNSTEAEYSPLSVDSNAISFGTFEANLLIAAANMMGSHSRNRELFLEQEMLLTGIVRAIINAIDAKDPYTCGHSERVASYAKHIANRIGLESEECERIYMAGLLHDVGKIGVPDSILGKPGKLTDEEFAIVKKHPEIGYTILKHLKQLDYVLPGVLHHHEAINGAGYPAGLIGESIPLQARILAVADAYDAMTSDRPYRSGMPSERAESILRAESNKTWDVDIVAALVQCIECDEIQPHSINSANSSGTNEIDTNSNSNLMRRIACSINQMASG
jgi:HD-GYP domain-containing protein (c-di-GMP phosphodiesterase class II)